MKTIVALALMLGLFGCSSFRSTDRPLRGLPIAKHAIPAGTIIHEQDIDILKLPKWEMDTPGLPRKISQIVGHKALENIPKTGPILLERISQ